MLMMCVTGKPEDTLSGLLGDDSNETTPGVTKVTPVPSPAGGCHGGATPESVADGPGVANTAAGVRDCPPVTSRDQCPGVMNSQPSTGGQQQATQDSNNSTMAGGGYTPTNNNNNSHMNNNNNNSTNSAVVKQCAGCGAKILDRFLLHAMDRYWHTGCLKCSSCQAQLGEIGTSCFAKSGMILCKSDYIRWDSFDHTLYY